MSKRQQVLDPIAILDRVASVFDLRTDADMAEFLGYTSASTISNWRKRRSIDLPVVLAACKAADPDLMERWIIWGEGEPRLPEDSRLLGEFIAKMKELQELGRRLESGEEKEEKIVERKANETRPPSLH